MTLATLGIPGSRSDYWGQFSHSGAPTMHAFLVQDILTGAGAHLIIDALLGLIGAAAAVAVLLLIRSQRAGKPTTPWLHGTPER